MDLVGDIWNVWCVFCFIVWLLDDACECECTSGWAGQCERVKAKVGRKGRAGSFSERGRGTEGLFLVFNPIVTFGVSVEDSLAFSRRRRH